MYRVVPGRAARAYPPVPNRKVSQGRVGPPGHGPVDAPGSHLWFMLFQGSKLPTYVGKVLCWRNLGVILCFTDSYEDIELLSYCIYEVNYYLHSLTFTNYTPVQYYSDLSHIAQI